VTSRFATPYESPVFAVFLYISFSRVILLSRQRSVRRRD
jgi:hypothetical protein